jgi:hypothetical protein
MQCPTCNHNRQVLVESPQLLLLLLLLLLHPGASSSAKSPKCCTIVQRASHDPGDSQVCLCSVGAVSIHSSCTISWALLMLLGTTTSLAAFFSARHGDTVTVICMYMSRLIHAKQARGEHAELCCPVCAQSDSCLVRLSHKSVVVHFHTQRIVVRPSNNAVFALCSTMRISLYL